MKIALNILLQFILLQSSAQNLVPNPSFEDYTMCPENLGEIDKAIGWEYYTPSPDYFNACSLQGADCRVPNNIFGYQSASSGDGYIGLVTYYYDGFGNSNTREFAGIQLSVPLVTGEKYYVSMKVNLSLSLPGWTNAASNKIGAWFTTQPMSSYTHNLSQIYTNNIIIDTTSWQSINGTFIADSNYTFIVLGNFFEDVFTDTISFFNIPNEEDVLAYYFIDDVCVSLDSMSCVGNVGILEISKPERKIIRIVDLMGRETEDKPNALLIYIYNDGTIEKVYNVE